MTCQELVHFLMSYLDSDLPSAERRRFEEHLTRCPDCVAYLRTYQEAVRLGRAVCTGDALPPEVPEELIQAILSARTTERSSEDRAEK